MLKRLNPVPTQSTPVVQWILLLHSVAHIHYCIKDMFSFVCTKCKEIGCQIKTVGKINTFFLNHTEVFIFPIFVCYIRSHFSGWCFLCNIVWDHNVSAVVCAYVFPWNKLVFSSSLSYQYRGGGCIYFIKICFFKTQFVWQVFEK